MADLGNLHFGVHLTDYTDAEADKIKKKLENLSVKLTIDGKNVHISQTDLIKKQIEDAIKTVSVQSVKIDTSAVKTQVNTALQGLNPQVSVTILKGGLSNDLQNYLNSKTFTIGITISRSSVQNAANTAFANLSMPVNVTVKASAAIQQLQQSLSTRNFKIGLEAKNPQDLIKDIKQKLGGKKIKADIEANPQVLVQSVKQALQGKLIKAQVDVNVDTQAITRAVQSAINNARFTYSPNGGNQRGTGSNRGQRAGGSYRQATQGLYETARASVSLGRSLSTNIRIAGELGSTLGNIASLFRIKELLTGIVQIGGQLENQRIALGAIIQDGGKAVEMFGKIQSLAVKSPFGIMDLNQYTKQLSSYGIEYNELYDTMKRMADISAGVGVDMGRIILAFGQVKAAGFLKGTELRQFTEANIPMVEKLAEKFSLLEKRIVSAGEVYDMISEKKVTFEDVKDVLWALTGEGGMFNNMQEVLSESLTSKWKNLSDVIDVMYGKMADGWAGTSLKAVAEGLTELTKKWENLVAIVGAAGFAFAAYKASVAIGSGTEAMGVYKQILANKKLEVSNLRVAQSYRALGTLEKAKLATAGQIAAVDLRQAVNAGVLTKEYALRLLAMKKLTQAQVELIASSLNITQAEIAQAAAVSRSAIAWGVFKNAVLGVGAALKLLLVNPWTWVFAGFSVLTSLVANAKQKADEAKRMTDEIRESATGSMQTIGKELDKLKNINIGELNDEELKIQINELSTLIKNEAPHWQSLLADVFKKDADGNFVRTAKEQLEELIKKIKEVQDVRQMLADDSGLFSDAIDATDESITKNLGDYSKEVEGMGGSLKKLGSFYTYIQTAITKAAGANKEFLEQSEGKSIQDKVILLSSYTEEFKKFGEELEKTSPRALSMINDYFDAFSSRNTSDKWETLADDTKTFTDKVWQVLLSKGYTLSNLDTVAKQFIYELGTRLVTNANITHPTVVKDFWTAYLKQFGMSYDEFSVVPPNAYKNRPESEYDASKDKVAKLWKKRAEEIDKAVKMYDKWKGIEGTEKARNRVQAKDELSNLFNDAYGFKLDLENPTAAYEYIQSKLNKNLSAQKELMVQLGVKISDSEFKDAQDKLKANMELLKREAEKTIQGWDLYKKLFEATGDKGTSMKIAFGKNVGFKDKLAHLRSQIEVEMRKLGSTIPFEKLIGMDTKDLESKGLGGLSDLIEKYNSENAKLKEESVKNFIDIIEASKDFAAQIEDIERKLEKDLKDLRANANGADTSRAEAQLRKNAAEDISKVNFEEFKQSSDWIRVFDDLNRVSDATLDNMITKIEEFAKQGRMSEEVTKQIVDAMAKLRKETIDRNPFEGFEDAWKRLRYFKGLRSRVGEYDEHRKLITQQMVDDGIAEANDDLEKSSLAVADKFQAVANAADLLSGIFDGFNTDLSGLKDVLGGIAGGAQSGAGIASAFGYSGPWGAIAGAAIGAISALFAQVDKSLQKEIESSERREKEIGNLAKNLQTALERNMGGIYSMKIDDASSAGLKDIIDKFNKAQDAYAKIQEGDINWDIWKEFREFSHLQEDTIDTIKEALKEDSYYDAQLAALKIQRDEVKKQMQLEDEKKKTDKNKMLDYKQQIHELDDAIAHFAEEMANTLYGIDFKDWAEQLATSMVDAWASGEDAAEAYKNTVNDILKDLGVSMISQQILEPLLQDTMNQFLSQFDKDNGKLTDSSLEILAGMTEEAEYAAKATEAYLEGLKKLGIDLSSTSDDAKEGLAKSIQGVTEDTAGLLASYINAIRQSVHVKQQFLEKLVSDDIPKMNYLAEAQLRELSQIQTNTAKNVALVGEIRDLVNIVVDKGGRKLKV